MNDFSDTIRNYRERAHISKSELARRLHVSPAYITMLENGKKNNPSTNIMLSLADILDIPFSELPIIEYQQDKALADATEKKLKEIKQKTKNITDEDLTLYEIVDLLEHNNYELSETNQNEIEICNLNNNTTKILNKNDFIKYSKSFLRELDELTKFQIKQWLKRI
ncbi:MAG: helix-turn-helix domain-containing protein [Clostridium neonatale]